MTTVNRVDQAILLLKDRLRRLHERSAEPVAKGGAVSQSEKSDPLVPLRQLARRGGIAEQELKRALVRMLLADALGEDLVGSLQFQSIADEVARLLDEHDTGRALMADALAEL